MLFEVNASDIFEISALIAAEAETGSVLPRCVDYVADHLPSFAIVRCDDRIIGCASYRIFYQIGELPIAEIRSLVVDPEYRKQGYGDFLMMEIAREIGERCIKRMFVFTLVPEFFKQYGFHTVDDDYVIKTTWLEDCKICRHNNKDCKEIFMVKEVI